MADVVRAPGVGPIAGFEGFVLDQLPAAVIVTDLAGTVVHWNTPAEALYGWTRGQAVGRSVMDLLVETSDTEPAADVMEVVRGGGVWEGEFELRRNDGSLLICRVTNSPIHDADGNVIGMVGVSVDVTARRISNQRLAARTAVTRILAEAADLAEAAPKVLEAICEALGWVLGELWQVDERTNVLRCVEVWATASLRGGEFEALSREFAFVRGVGLPGRVWESGQPAWISDVSVDPNFPRGAAARAEGLHGALGFPIVLAGHVLGVIEFFSHEIREPDDDLLQVFGIMGSQIGQFMERKEAESELRDSEARTRAILEAALDCVITMDANGNVVEWNPAAERTFGRSREEVLGREMAELIIPGEYRDLHRRGLAHYLATGEAPVLHQRLELSGMRADGSEFPVELTITRVEPFEPPLFTGFLRDITDRKQAEEELRRSRDQLQAIFQGVAEGITVQDASGQLVYANDAAAHSMGFPTAEALLGESVENVMTRFELFDESGARVQVDSLPGRRALQGLDPGEAVLRFRTLPGGTERWSLVRASPVFDQRGNVQLAINIFHDITERKRAEEYQRFLAEAGELLAASVIDFEATLARVAELAVPRLADWCAIDVLQEDGSTKQIKVAHVDPAKVDFAKELGERYPPDPQAPTGVPNVLRTGRSEIYPEIPAEMLAAAAIDEEHLEIIRSLQLRSAMIVPLVARGRTLGAITFISAESGRLYTDADLALAEDLARRAGLAVDNARLYKERDHIARTLQESLLPPELPMVPGLQIAARYRPAGEGNEVGGDFYDVFETGDGTWGIVIGDVCGKGPEAAAVTGLARHTIRAAAMRERRPSEILATLNGAVLQQRPDSIFCTVAYVRVRPDADGARLTVCCGGHPLPLVIRADGAVETAGRPGTLLGIFPDPDLEDRPVQLEKGDSMVLFTDGVIEEHGEGRVFGRDRLTAILHESAGLDAKGIAAAIDQAVMDFRPHAPRDDIAIIVLKVAP